VRYTDHTQQVEAGIPLRYLLLLAGSASDGLPAAPQPVPDEGIPAAPRRSGAKDRRRGGPEASNKRRRGVEGDGASEGEGGSVEQVSPAPALSGDRGEGGGEGSASEAAALESGSDMEGSGTDSDDEVAGGYLRVCEGGALRLPSELM
jgi:hypothetical protein